MSSSLSITMRHETEKASEYLPSTSVDHSALTWCIRKASSVKACRLLPTRVSAGRAYQHCPVSRKRMVAVDTCAASQAPHNSHYCSKKKPMPSQASTRTVRHQPTHPLQQRPRRHVVIIITSPSEDLLAKAEPRIINYPRCQPTQG